MPNIAKFSKVTAELETGVSYIPIYMLTYINANANIAFFF